MSGIKISALPAIISPTLTDVLPTVQGGVTYKVSNAQLAALFGFSGGILPPANGGTGIANPTAHTLPVAEGSSNFNFLGPLTNGQLLIGSTGADPVPASVIAGTGITVIPGAGTLTIAATGGAVNPGTINDLAYYATTSSSVSPLATANNGTLITSGAGVPSISSTLPSAVQTNITALGAQAQALNMNSHLINNVLDPVSAQDAATKNYVDTTALNGTSVYAATTGNLTVTQSGAGIGATLTNAGAQATFALDSVNPPLGSNVLIKNLVAPQNEGIYTVTNVGSGATNWVLTRATTYDTPTEINLTGLIIVQNGTTLAGTAWLNSATIITVDTTAFNYSEFGNITFPITLAHGGTNANLTASNGGIFYSTATAGALLSGTATARQMLQSGATGAPAWSTSTYPATNAANTLLYASSANTMAALATANDGVLVTSNAGVPSILAGPGSTGLTLLSQAAAAPIWSTSSPITKVVKQVFTSSGTYTPTAGMVYAWCRLVAGGGAGGGTIGVSGQIANGSGGGSGAYSEVLLTAAQIGASQTVTIGAGGIGSTGNGTSGSASSLGTLLTANGGSFGSTASASATLSTANGGVGGTAGTGDLSMPGMTGGNGVSNGAIIGVSGAGGNSLLGAGGNSVIESSLGAINGVAGSNYGAGGSGGVSLSLFNSTGGNGSAGVLIIEEYLSI